jgi:hypothetical protein
MSCFPCHGFLEGQVRLGIGIYCSAVRTFIRFEDELAIPRVVCVGLETTHDLSAISNPSAINGSAKLPRNLGID